MEATNIYQNGKIYKLVCNKTNKCYVGSTITSLNERLRTHKKDYKRYKKGLLTHFVTSFEIIENDNYEIILIENFYCNSKRELEEKERYYIENTDCINKIIPTRTKREYYQENKEEIIEYQRKYREDNRELINEYHRKYYQEHKDELSKKASEKITCECGSIVSRQHLLRHYKTNKHINFINNNNNI